MSKDAYIADMERQMPVPITSFPWQDQTRPWEWAAETEELLRFIEKKGQQSSVIFTGDGSRYGHDGANTWKACLGAAQFIILTSPPCEGHIFRSRMLNVLEKRLPDQDDFHGQVMARFGEAMHVVKMKEFDY